MSRAAAAQNSTKHLSSKFNIQANQWASNTGSINYPAQNDQNQHRTGGQSRRRKNLNSVHISQQSDRRPSQKVPNTPVKFNIPFVRKSLAVDPGQYVSKIVQDTQLKFSCTIHVLNIHKANVVVEISQCSKVSPSSVSKHLEVQLKKSPQRASINIPKLQSELILGPGLCCPTHSQLMPVFISTSQMDDEASPQQHQTELDDPFQVSKEDLTMCKVSLYGLPEYVDEALSFIESKMENSLKDVRQFKFSLPKSKISLFNDFQMSRIFHNSKCLLKFGETTADDKSDSGDNQKESPAFIVGKVNAIPRALAYILGVSQCYRRKSITVEPWAFKSITSWMFGELQSLTTYQDVELKASNTSFSVTICGTDVDLHFFENGIKEKIVELKEHIYIRSMDIPESIHQALEPNTDLESFFSSVVQNAEITIDGNLAYVVSTDQESCDKAFTAVYEKTQACAKMATSQILISDDLKRKCYKIKSMSIKSFLFKNTNLNSKDVSTDQDRANNTLRLNITGHIDELNELSDRFNVLKSEMNDLYYSKTFDFDKDDNPIFRLEGMKHHIQQMLGTMKVDFLSTPKSVKFEGHQKNVEMAAQKIFDEFNKICSYNQEEVIFNTQKKVQLLSKLDPKKMLFTIRSSENSKSESILTVFSRGDLKPLVKHINQTINSLTAESCARFVVSKAAWQFVTKKPSAIHKLSALSGVFNVDCEPPKATAQNEPKHQDKVTMLVYGQKGQNFVKSSESIHDMMQNHDMKSIKCPELARMHLNRLSHKSTFEVKLPALDREIAKMDDGLVLYFYTSPNLIIKGHKHAVAKLAPIAENLISSITNLIHHYPNVICGAILGKKASKKIELQDKFNVSIIIPNLLQNHNSEARPVEAVGTEEDCKKFHDHIHKNFKEISINVPNSIVGAVCGRESKNVKELMKKYNVIIHVSNLTEEDSSAIKVLGFTAQDSDNCVEELNKLISNNLRVTIKIPDAVLKYLNSKSNDIFNIKKTISPSNCYVSDGSISFVGTSDKVKLGEKMINDLIKLIEEGQMVSVSFPQEICGRIFGKLMKNIRRLESEYSVKIYAQDEPNSNTTKIDIFGQNVEVVKSVADVLSKRAQGFLQGPSSIDQNQQLEEEVIY